MVLNIEEKKDKQKDSYKAAIVQFNPILNERDENLKNLLIFVTEAAKNGAKLIVTPEMATTGYYYKNREAIKQFVDTIPGDTTRKFELIAKKYETYIIIGMPEVDEETEIYYNSAALVGPEGYIGKYRKIHQWETEGHWAALGDLGVPVFKTKLGNIAINICMDSLYFEASRLAALNGADIIVFPTNSTAISISLLQAWAEINGLYVLSANRSNTENGYHMIGASAIWSPYGEKIVESKFIEKPKDDIDLPTIFYGEIDTTKYNNEAKKRLWERRPELYKDLMLYIAPWDYTKNIISHNLTGAIIQYEPIVGNKVLNMEKVKHLINKALTQAKNFKRSLNLIVLPELSVIGPVDELSISEISELAETTEGPSLEEIKNIAKENNFYIVFGFLEKEDSKLFNTAALIGPMGEVEGKYRKTHLNKSDRRWADPGDQIKVFNTKIGRLGIMIGYDAAFPEIAGVLAVNRADIIAIPSSWYGEFGKEIAKNKNISASRYTEGALTTWDAIATGSQAYTLVANFVGTYKNFLGSSALYTLDPHYGLDQPIIAAHNKEEALVVNFSLIQSDWWYNQEKLIISRRTIFYKPLVIEKKENNYNVESIIL